MGKFDFVPVEFSIFFNCVVLVKSFNLSLLNQGLSNWGKLTAWVIREREHTYLNSYSLIIQLNSFQISTYWFKHLAFYSLADSSKISQKEVKGWQSFIKRVFERDNVFWIKWVWGDEWCLLWLSINVSLILANWTFVYVLNIYLYLLIY